METSRDALHKGLLDGMEWRRLSTLASELDPSLEGTLQNFLVRPFGAAASTATGLLSRAIVLKDDGESTEHKVLLKLRHADWLALEDSTGVFKVLQSQVHVNHEDFMLDCSHPHTTVICTAVLETGAAISMAEIFSGGFSGWSQAAYVMHRGGTPIHTSWSLDVDPECEAMLRLQNPGLHCIWQTSELEDILDDTPAGVHVCTNVHSEWWLRMFAIRPVHIIAVSPPCQPWSTAGSGAGLQSEDGMLMLRIVDILGAVQVPVVALEQVGGFLKHPHAPTVLSAWSEVGYSIAWQATIDLLDVLPCSRSRTLIIFRHRTCRGPPALSGINWACTRRHNLATAQVLFDLPGSLLQPLVLSEELKTTYLDPWFMPPSRLGRVTQSRVDAFRIKTAAATAGCFMAQYQFQHELPPRQLETKGLLGFVLRHQGVLRFFSGAEIAALHGAVRPILLQENRRSQMRLLGNSLAVPQAAAGLAFACHALGCQSSPEPAEAVATCLSARLHNANTFFLPKGADWILCRKDQVADVLSSGEMKPLPPPSQTAPIDFVPLTFQTGHAEVTLYAPAGAQALRVFAHLGVAHLAPTLPVTAHDRLHALRLSVAALPSLDCAGFFGGCANREGLCTVLVCGGAFIIDTWSPRMWTQLLNVFDFLTSEAEDLCCWRPTGQKLRFADDFDGCVVACTSPAEAPELPLSLIAKIVPDLRMQFQAGAACLSCPAASATECWLGFPFHLALAYGWDAQVGNFPPTTDAPMTIDLHPILTRLHLQPPTLPRQLRSWFLVACLEGAAVAPSDEGATLVEVQIEARRIWWGHLHDLSRATVLLQWWQEASQVCQTPPAVRVFSGPHPVQDDDTLLAIRSRTRQRTVRRAGHLLLTLQPCIVGGGGHNDLQASIGDIFTKDNKKKWRWLSGPAARPWGRLRWTKGGWRVDKMGDSEEVLSIWFNVSKSLEPPEKGWKFWCSKKGRYRNSQIYFEDLGAFVDAITKAGSTARLSQAVKATSEDAKWNQLGSYAKELDVPVPQAASLFQRADQRAKRQLQKHRAQQSNNLKASAVQVQEGFFVNDDETPAQILDAIRPGATGLLLVDGDQAADALNTLQGVQSDELGILVLGHTCPDPASCSRRISFPATGRVCKSQLLLAGCLHNVGGKAIRPSKQADITVALPDILCCTFTAFADDFPAGQSEQIVQAPVKQLLSAFHDVDAAKAITTPCGRQFRCKGKIAAPTAADQVSFQARVPKGDCDALLIASGHNSVYITPRKLDHSLLSGYSIIWIGSHQLALKLRLGCSDAAAVSTWASKFSWEIKEPAPSQGEAEDADREILELGQDIVLASETSAVATVQRIVAHKLRPTGLTTVWSAPVVFVVYGYPANYQDAGGRNAALFQTVLRRLIDCPVLALVGGDFNTDVTALPEFDLFRQLGFVEAFIYWQQCTGILLPPTCKNATRHDTLLVPDILLPYVTTMRVAADLHFFDSHAPFIAEFGLPVAPRCKQGWRKPRTWMSVLPPHVDLSPHYARYQGQVQEAITACQTSDDLDAAFQTWAAATEAAVDAAVRTAHDIDPGRDGDYAPPCEAAQFCQEWAAITRGRGYAPNFATWLLRCSHFQEYWSSLPPLAWIREVLQYVRFDADAHVRAEADHRRKLTRFQVHQDSSSGSSRIGYRSLRPHPRPPFTCIPYEENQEAQLVRSVSAEAGLYSVPMPRFVKVGQTAHLGDVPVQVVSIKSNEIDGSLLLLKGPSQSLPSVARFVQPSSAATAAELNRVFIEFWAPIWCRGKGPARTDPAYWATFLQQLPPAPSAARTLSIDMRDPDVWARQVKRLKNGRATGYCGFSPEEIKTLPPAAVGHLAQLFARCERCGFPKHLAQATVHVLAKVDEPLHIGQGRPITVYATVYRLWSSVAARAILQQWATWMPESVRGCLPGRGAREVSLVIQVMLESALLTGQAMGGFSLDIVKCFNQIPRQPLRQLLQHLHVPSDILEIWFQFLECNTRFALFHGDLGTPIASTTGVPEGDPLSVVGQIAICWALVARPLAKDLGVAFRFDRCGGLGKAAAHIAEGLQRLKRLQRQHRPLQNAAHLVQSGIWPAALYGLEGHHVPDNKLDQLRTGAARGICGDRHCMSPHLALECLTSAVLDPAVYLLVQALCALRRLLRVLPDYGQKWLNLTCDTAVHSRRACGPATSLAKQLRAQGWVLRADGVLKGAGHWHLCLFHSTPKQIRTACQAAWNETIHERVGHRNGLHQARCPCPKLMTRVLRKFPEGAQLHLAHSVVGGFQSRAARATYDPLVEKACPYCGETDTKAHRLLQCPATASVREPFQALLQWVCETCPHWLHAPFPTAHDDEGFLRLLWSSRRMPPPPDLGDILGGQPSLEHALFTDGSCVHPTCPAARHAAWSVILHNQCTSVPDLRLIVDEPDLLRATFPVVAQGLLPGEQNIYRAEVAALVQIVCIAAAHPARIFHAWTDSSSALSTLRDWLQSSPADLPQMSAAADLLAHLPGGRPQNLYLHKAKSHQSLSAVPREELLQVVGNYVADAAAKAAEKDDLPGLSAQLDAVAAWRDLQEANLFTYFQYLLEVTKFVGQLRTAAYDSTADNGYAAVGAAERHQQWCALDNQDRRCMPPPPGPVDLANRLQLQTSWPPGFLHCLHDWSQQLQWPTAGPEIHAMVQLVLLDCGLVIDLSGQAGEDLSAMLKAFLTKSEEDVARLLISLSERVGGKPEDVVQPEVFVNGIASLIRSGKGVGFRLSKLNAGSLMGQSLLLGRKHGVRFDARFVNLMVAMIVVQGVSLRLNGDGDIMSRMRPFLFGAAVSHLTS
ncbi:unnamed protein product [Symbiodinium sp. CCMP2592]|nr:unnamed protein product [Symbiodinium sp. CCMP2592]